MFNSSRFTKFLSTGSLPAATALDAAMSEWEESDRQFALFGDDEANLYLLKGDL